MATKKKTTTRTRKSKSTKEETTGGVDGAEKKPVEENMTRGRKLDPTKVLDIRARLAKGEKASDIAAVYSLHPSSVDDIRVGRTWSSVV